MQTLHRRAFAVTVVWTLLLLYLGSVVHATGSSLACPDWPTCYGTMVPEMRGGIFWEHLHRLVAGGLILMFLLATWLARRETRDRPWIFRACLGGIALLLVQALFGGITVLLRLPPWASTTHLALALLFLSLVTVLATASAPPVPGLTAEEGETTARWGRAAAVLVFLQSVLGALVRHTHAGMACPDVPLCAGRLIPPLDSGLMVLQVLHRLLGLIVAFGVVWMAVRSLRSGAPRTVRMWAGWAGVLVIVQIGLGFLSVMTALAVVPVSLHTLVAASILAISVHLATAGNMAVRAARGRPAREPV